MRKVDLTGQRFGKLLVISRAHYSEKGHTYYWNCLCDCGQEKTLAACAIKRQESCGCERNARYMESKRTLTQQRHLGEVYGTWKVIAWASANKNNSHNYLAECLKCGAQEVKKISCIIRDQLRCNSCEVAHHFQFPQDLPKNYKRDNRKLYDRWYCMMDRCYRPSADNYYAYGAIGIAVDDRWTNPNGFMAFKSWIESNYPNWENLFAKGYQLDRKDGTKGYSPENCRLIDGDLNNKLKTHHRMVMWQGKEVPLRGLVERYSNLKYVTVRARIDMGWTVEDALAKPLVVERKRAPKPNRRTKRVVYMGEECVLSELVKEFSLTPYEVVIQRINDGWDVETALLLPRKARRSDLEKYIA